jgi:hypothetical protein
MMSFEKKVELFNFLTMLRVDCKGDYTEANTILGTSSFHPILSLHSILTLLSTQNSVLLHRTCKTSRRTQSAVALQQLDKHLMLPHKLVLLEQ